MEKRLVNMDYRALGTTHVAWWEQDNTASLFWAFCMRCAFPKAITASKIWVRFCGFWRTMCCDGFVSSTITSRSMLASAIIEVHIQW